LKEINLLSPDKDSKEKKKGEGNWKEASGKGRRLSDPRKKKRTGAVVFFERRRGEKSKRTE